MTCFHVRVKLKKFFSLRFSLLENPRGEAVFSSSILFIVDARRIELWNLAAVCHVVV